MTVRATKAEVYAKEESSAKKTLLERFRGLTTLYPGHIWKQGYVLFPMSNKILVSEEQRQLHEKFRVAEKEIIIDVHQRLEELPEGLVRRIA